MKNDELMHPTGNDNAWSESYYFNFIDPESKIGMFTRMGFRPANGWADALHVIYLPGKRVAFTYGRRNIGEDLSVYNGDLTAGGLTLRCLAPHEKWQLLYEGAAEDIPNAEVLLQRKKDRNENWFAPTSVSMALDFACLTKPHYAPTGGGERGHFEQSGRVTGNISIGNESFVVNGFGVRDKSWGPRDWGAGNTGDEASADTDKPLQGPQPFVNWFSMNFGEHAALGGSCVRHQDGVMRGEGWLQRDGESTDLTNVVIETQYASDSIIHKSVVLQAQTANGEKIKITGNVLSVCPTKIPMPGGATFVNEGLTQFQWEGRTGFGIAEHWHSVKL